MGESPGMNESWLPFSCVGGKTLHTPLLRCTLHFQRKLPPPPPPPPQAKWGTWSIVVEKSLWDSCPSKWKLGQSFRHFGRKVCLFISSSLYDSKGVKICVHSVCFPGQDVERGTFGHRHHIIRDQKVDKKEYE